MCWGKEVFQPSHHGILDAIRLTAPALKEPTLKEPTAEDALPVHGPPWIVSALVAGDAFAVEGVTSEFKAM